MKWFVLCLWAAVVAGIIVGVVGEARIGVRRLMMAIRMIVCWMLQAKRRKPMSLKRLENMSDDKV